jgi:HK97 family phage portal protein
MIDRIIDKVVKFPVVKKAIDKAISTSIEQQPASSQQETKPSRNVSNLVANDENYYSIDRDVDTQIAKSDLGTYLNLYRQLLWTFRGVNTIAGNGAMVPAKVWQPVSLEENKEFKIHPIYKLWRSPNNLNTRFELIFKTIAYMELTGNAYWFIERDNSGLPTKLHIPRPDRIEPKLETSTGKVNFERKRTKVNSVPENWVMEDVVHFTHFNPVSDYQGYPTVAASEDNAIIELYLLVYGKTFFKNAIYPSQIFQSKTRLSDETFERFHAQMRKLHAGVDNWSKVLLLDEDVAPIDDRRKTPADSEMLDSRRNAREELLMGLGCYHLVALLQGKTGSALRDSKQMFWEETMLPRLTNLEETMSKELLWSNYPESDELVIAFDTRKIRGLREDSLAESLANYRYWQMGVKTPNDIRRDLGEDGKVDWGDDKPPTIPTARSRTLPNDERAFLEDALPHPERYQEDVNDNSSKEEKMLSRVDNAASEIAYELNKELGDSSNGDRNVSETLVKDCLLKEWYSCWL